MKSLDVAHGYKRIKWQKFTAVVLFTNTWAERMSFNSFRFTYVQFSNIFMSKHHEEIFFFGGCC